MNDVGVCIAALSTLGLLKMCFLADKVVELVGGGDLSSMGLPRPVLLNGYFMIVSYVLVCY